MLKAVRPLLNPGGAEMHEWVEEFPGAVTVCDPEGIILEMNDQAARMFSKSGGRALIGSNLFDCHPEPARSKLRQIMDVRQVNVYTTEKKGIKWLVHQSPWHLQGEYRGFVEIVVQLPAALPHFVRDAAS
jgi:PAS domain-containing protein